MKIVILDGQLVNPGDVSWDRIEKLGDLTVYGSTSEEEMDERLKDADIAILDKTKLAGRFIKNANNLKYITLLATGYDNVDLTECKERGIKVSNVPAYGTDTVAQFAFALLLEVCNNVKTHSDEVFNKNYIGTYKYGRPLIPQRELSGKTIGIIGYGNIGRKVGEIAKAFGMKVLAYRGENKGKCYDEEVSLDYLLENSDVISIHAKLTDENRGIINKNTISKMKKNAIIVNVARGGLIVEEDLRDALNSDRILGAGIDVVCEEPIKGNNVLLDAKNLVITPHIAWTTKEARERIIGIASKNIEGFLTGDYINLVD